MSSSPESPAEDEAAGVGLRPLTDEADFAAGRGAVTGSSGTSGRSSAVGTSVSG